MQTFFTQPSYGKTARDLDDRRLWVQMTDCQEIFDHLTGVKPNSKHRNNPVMYMWRGYEFALAIYAMMLGLEWTMQRGFLECKPFFWFSHEMDAMKKTIPGFTYEEPPWVRDPAVLFSHRSNLRRKDPSLYGHQWKNCPENWPYIWPVVDEDGGYELKISRADIKRMKDGERALPDAATIERISNWP